MKYLLIKRLFSVGFLGGFIFIFFFLFSAVSSAGFGVTVAPIKYKVEVDPGETISQVITVANPNEVALKVRPEFQDFKVTEGNNIQWIPIDVENPYKMSDWIRINQEAITLKPRQEAQVPFKIVVPKNATAGGHYAAIFFTGILEGEEGNIGAVPRVGSLIILNVKGDLKRSGQIISFITKRFVFGGPVKFDLSFLNTGTTHLETRADIVIRNFFWKSGEVTSDTKFVYPNIKRDFSVSWDKKLLLGFYTAKAEMLDGDGKAHQKSTWFIGFPLKLLLTIIVVLAAIWALRRWFRSKFKIVKV